MNYRSEIRMKLLLYAWDVILDWHQNRKKRQYISDTLLELGYCTECENKRTVEIISCSKPMSECCGGCEVTVECENCK